MDRKRTFRLCSDGGPGSLRGPRCCVRTSPDRAGPDGLQRRFGRSRCPGGVGPAGDFTSPADQLTCRAVMLFMGRMETSRATVSRQLESARSQRDVVKTPLLERQAESGRRGHLAQRKSGAATISRRRPIAETPISLGPRVHDFDGFEGSAPEQLFRGSESSASGKRPASLARARSPARSIPTSLKKIRRNIPPVRSSFRPQPAQAATNNRGKSPFLLPVLRPRSRPPNPAMRISCLCSRVLFFALTIGPIVANAQTMPVSSPTGAADSPWLKDRRYTEGAGYRIGNLELHPGLAGEFGYDSNYFLRSDNDEVRGPAAARFHLWKITPSLSVSTLSAQRERADCGHSSTRLHLPRRHQCHLPRAIPAERRIPHQRQALHDARNVGGELGFDAGNPTRSDLVRHGPTAVSLASLPCRPSKAWRATSTAMSPRAEPELVFTPGGVAARLARRL